MRAQAEGTDIPDPHNSVNSVDRDEMPVPRARLSGLEGIVAILGKTPSSAVWQPHHDRHTQTKLYGTTIVLIQI